MKNKMVGVQSNAAVLKRICLVVSFLVLSLILAAGLYLNALETQRGASQNLGTYTFDQSFVEADGTVAEIHASGDQYYNYLHDDLGYVLTPSDDGYLYYAVSDDGRPVASDVRWNASKIRVNALPKMTLSDVNLADNPDLLNEFPSDSIDKAPLLAGADVTRVFNVVIYIQFSDENYTAANLTDEIKNAFSNDESTQYSLANYYSQQTYGEKSINNVFAYDTSNAYYIYKDTNPRSYYAAATDATRNARESELLQGAITGFNNAAARDAFTGAQLDANSDGKVDSISFVLMGSTSNVWSSLLWPHQWDAYSAGFGTTTVGGTTKRAGAFSFQFMTPTTSKPYVFAVITHETGHVFGAPDYYSYENSSVTPVGEWDLMGNTSASTRYPANMLVYTRKTYLGMSGGIVQTVNTNQTVTLKSTVSAGSTDVVAVKIPTTVEGVSLYAEYRQKTATGQFDSGQTSSGLVVYRVNENATGNSDCTSYTDFGNIETYVYRPTAGVYSGALSPTNGSFNMIGMGTSYPLTLNATNELPVTITAISEDKVNNTMTFSVVGEGMSVDDDYFLDNVSLTSAEYTTTALGADGNAVYGVAVEFSTIGLDVNRLYSLKLSLLDVDGNVTQTAFANRAALSDYNDTSAAPVAKSAVVLLDADSPGESTWFTTSRTSDAAPVKVRLSVVDTDNDEIVLADNLDIDTAGLRWAEDVLARAEGNRLQGMTLSANYIEVKAGGTVSISISSITPSLGGSPSVSTDCDESIFVDYSFVSIGGTFSWNVVSGAPAGEVYPITINVTSDGITVSETVLVKIIAATDTAYSAFATVAVKSGSTNVHYIGTPWSSHRGVATLGGFDVALNSVSPYAFNEYASGTQTVYFEYNHVLYKYDVDMNDRPLYGEMNETNLELVKGQPLPNTALKLYYYGGVYALNVNNNYSLGSFTKTGYDPNVCGAQRVTVTWTATNGAAPVSWYYDVYVAEVTAATLEGETTTHIGSAYFVAEISIVAGNPIIDYGNLSLTFNYRTNTDTVTKITAELATSTSNSYEFFFVATVSGATAEGYYTNGVVNFYRRNGGALYLLGTIENVKFRLLKMITMVAIVYKGSAPETEGGYNVFYYDERESWVFARRVEYSDMTSEDIVYTFTPDVERLDVGYNLTDTYFGHTATPYPIIVKDTVVSIAVEATSHYYGENLVLNVTATFAAGGTASLSADEYDGEEAYNKNASLGVVQNLTITVSTSYAKLKPSTVVSAVVSVAPIDGVKTISLSTGDYIAEYFYGATEFVVDYINVFHYYGATEKLSTRNIDYAVAGFDSTLIADTSLSANCTVILTYGGRSTTAVVTIKNYAATVALTSPQLSSASGMYEREYGNAADPFTVRVTYANGQTENLSVAVSNTTLNTSLIGKQTVSISVSKSETLLKTITVDVLLYISTLLTPSLLYSGTMVDGAVVLKHGEALDLSKFQVKWSSNLLTLSNNSCRISSDDYSIYQSATEGVAQVSIEVFALKRGLAKISPTFTVNLLVSPRVGSDMLSVVADGPEASKIVLDTEARTIKLSAPIKIADLISALSSVYMDVGYTTGRATTDFAGGYELSEGRRMQFAVTLSNASGTVIELYAVRLTGDMNGDGNLTVADIDAMADAYLSGDESDYTMDVIGGELDIDSFVKWILKLNDTPETETTPQDLFSGFVCDGLRKREVAV